MSLHDVGHDAWKMTYTAVPVRSKKKKKFSSKREKFEVIYQSRGPSLRAVKHESSGLFFFSMSTAGSCHDVKTLMDWTRLAEKYFSFFFRNNIDFVRWDHHGQLGIEDLFYASRRQQGRPNGLKIRPTEGKKNFKEPAITIYTWWGAGCEIQ